MGKESGESTERKRSRFQRGLRKKHSERIGDINTSPTGQNHVSRGAGRTGLQYRYRLRLKRTDVCLTITGLNKEQHEKLFDWFYDRKDLIEQRFGEPLEWKRKEGSNVCRVVYRVTDAGVDDEEQWEQIQHELVTAMEKLISAFERPIADLPE